MGVLGPLPPRRSAGPGDRWFATSPRACGHKVCRETDPRRRRDQTTLWKVKRRGGVTPPGHARAGGRTSPGWEFFGRKSPTLVSFRKVLFLSGY